MPQVQLPIFPVGTTPLTAELAFERREQQVVYFNGHLPVFTHEVGDLATFRFFTSQLIANGTVSQAEIARGFGVPLRTVKRYIKLYREKGAKGFFTPPARRGGPKLTAERLAEARGLLEQGRSVPEIGREIGVLATTLHKALDDGRLIRPKKKARRS
jgi:transposase-like protein